MHLCTTLCCANVSKVSICVNSIFKDVLALQHFGDRSISTACQLVAVCKAAKEILPLPMVQIQSSTKCHGKKQIQSIQLQFMFCSMLQDHAPPLEQHTRPSLHWQRLQQQPERGREQFCLAKYPKQKNNATPKQKERTKHANRWIAASFQNDVIHKKRTSSSNSNKFEGA